MRSNALSSLLLLLVLLIISSPRRRQPPFKSSFFFCHGALDRSPQRNTTNYIYFKVVCLTSLDFLLTLYSIRCDRSLRLSFFWHDILFKDSFMYSNFIICLEYRLCSCRHLIHTTNRQERRHQTNLLTSHESPS